MSTEKTQAVSERWNLLVRLIVEEFKRRDPNALYRSHPDRRPHPAGARADARRWVPRFSMSLSDEELLTTDLAQVATEIVDKYVEECEARAQRAEARSTE